MKRIVITGMGMITSLGLDKESSFENICAGKTGIKKISCFDTTDFSVKIAGEIEGFNPADVVDDGKEIKKMDRFIQLGLKATIDAMRDANFSEFNEDEFGVVSAAGIGGLPNIETNSLACKEKGPRRVSPFFYSFSSCKYAWRSNFYKIWS